MGHGIYNKGIMGILLCFVSADGSTGVVTGLKVVWLIFPTYGFTDAEAGKFTICRFPETAVFVL
jgi:hypothetical protein